MRILFFVSASVIFLFSCTKEGRIRNRLENSMYKFTKITETPISNEFGSIQCATECSLENIGGIKFGDTDWQSPGGNGSMAFAFPHDSIKIYFEQSWAIAEVGNKEYELHINDYVGGKTYNFKINPADIKKEEFSMYYEEKNACGDLVRYTFYLKKI